MQWSRGAVAVVQSCSYLIHLFTLRMIKPVLKKIAYVSFQPQVNYVDTISKPRISSQDTRLQSLVYPLLFLQSFLVALRQRVDYRDHEVGNLQIKVLVNVPFIPAIGASPWIEQIFRRLCWSPSHPAKKKHYFLSQVSTRNWTKQEVPLSPALFLKLVNFNK